jgi:hypothetical protein
MTRTLYLSALLLIPLACERSGFDGDDCVEDDDCDSGYCNQGYCGGSSCECDNCEEAPEPSDDCEDGWDCTYIPPSFLDDIGAAIGSFFGGDGNADGRYLCQATCGSCPPTHHCGHRTEGLCEYGAPTPELTFEMPTEEIVPGEETILRVTPWVETGSVVRYVWSFTAAGMPTTETVESVEPLASHIFPQGGYYTVEVTAHADNGTSATTSSTVSVCGMSGDVCAATCCGGMSCSFDGYCL